MPIPVESIKYENLDKLAREHNSAVGKDRDNAFYHIISPHASKSFAPNPSDTLGWKMHISVHRDDLAAAFDLVAPILCQYCYTFKVRHGGTIFGNANSRTLIGSQITAYLGISANSDEHAKPLSADDARRMMQEISSTLHTKGIRSGIFPESDAKTEFEYCSIRNDAGRFFARDADGDYIEADLAGRNFNPVNEINPYRSLLTPSPVTIFDPAQHFLAFNLRFQGEAREERNRKVVCVGYTMLAFLREHTIIDTFENGEQWKQFTADCENNSAKLNNYLRSNDQNNIEIIDAVKIAIKVILFIQKNRNDYYGVTFDDIDCLYHHKNSFLIFLKTLMEKLASSELTDATDFVGYVSAEKLKLLTEKLIDKPSDPVSDQNSFIALMRLIDTGNCYDSLFVLKMIERSFFQKMSFIENQASVDTLIIELENMPHLAAHFYSLCLLLTFKPEKFDEITKHATAIFDAILNNKKIADHRVMSNMLDNLCNEHPLLILHLAENQNFIAQVCQLSIALDSKNTDKAKYWLGKIDGNIHSLPKWLSERVSKMREDLQSQIDFKALHSHAATFSSSPTVRFSSEKSDDESFLNNSKSVPPKPSSF